ncbi:MAG: hypothetical protein KTR18_11370 [Acidiferrobacterales bacterium]|nr:hypothetical protein [Acidiferrobacterales bacterium]
MMKNCPKLALGLISAALIAGCSSGGGTTSSGDGLGVQTTESNLLLLSTLSPGPGGGFDSETLSVDAFIDLCEAAEIDDEGNITTEPVFETGLTTKTGNFTIVARDLVDASGLTPVEFFPEGVVFTRYQVSYTSPNSFAPTLRDRTFQQTMVLPNGSSEATFSIILVDLDVILQDFQVQSSGSVASYNVKVTATGAEFNGTPLSVSAETFLEIGNFNRCDGN